MKFRNISNIENVLGEFIVVEIYEKRVYKTGHLSQDKLNGLINRVLEIDISNENLFVDNMIKLCFLIELQNKYPDEHISFTTKESKEYSDENYNLRKQREKSLLDFLNGSEFEILLKKEITDGSKVKEDNN